MRVSWSFEFVAMKRFAGIVKDDANPNELFVDRNVEPDEPGEQRFSSFADEFSMPQKTGRRSNLCQ
jgi:hypothetical protein